jgi:CDGSH-type Zn-finger protein
MRPPAPLSSGLAVDLPVGLRQPVSDQVVQALLLAGVAARMAGRREASAGDLLDAVVAVTSTPRSAREAAEQAGPLPYTDPPDADTGPRDGTEPRDDGLVVGPPRAPRPSAPARITPYRDGPYLLRGPFELTDQDGAPIRCTRQTVALCRCGRSQIRPFCDGTHKLVGFRAGSEAEIPKRRSD